MFNMKIGKKSQPEPKDNLVMKETVSQNGKTISETEIREGKFSPETTRNPTPEDIARENGLEISSDPSARPSSEDLTTSSQPTSEPPTHFDDLIQPKAVETQPGQGAASPSRPGMLRKQDFRKLFVGAQGGLGKLTGTQALKLPNSEVEVSDAFDCSDAIYDTIVDIPALHFLLHPGNKWLERVATVGLYSAAMARAIAMEKAAAIPRDENGQNVQDAKPNFSRAKEATEQPGPVGGMPNAEQRAVLVGG